MTTLDHAIRLTELLALDLGRLASHIEGEVPRGLIADCQEHHRQIANKLRHCADLATPERNASLPESLRETGEGGAVNMLLCETCGHEWAAIDAAHAREAWRGVLTMAVVRLDSVAPLLRAHAAPVNAYAIELMACRNIANDARAALAGKGAL